MKTIKSKMLFLLSMLTLRVYSAEAQNTFSERIVCDGIIFNDVYFDRELLATDYGRPYSLTLHKQTGKLFFSYTIRNDTFVDFAIAVCDLKKKSCKDVPGIPGGYAVAHDAANDEIYLGGHDGIYKYNFFTHAAEPYAEKGHSIWLIFVKKNFYYVEYPSQSLFVYQNDHFVPVAEAIGVEVDQFFISRSVNIYFSNRTALYKVERPERHTIRLSDDLVIRQIAEDTFGDVYFCASDGIYVENLTYHRLKKIATIDKAFGLTFDGDDKVIYSDADSVYRLQTSKYTTQCYDAIQQKFGSYRDERRI